MGVQMSTTGLCVDWEVGSCQEYQKQSDADMSMSDALVERLIQNMCNSRNIMRHVYRSKGLPRFSRMVCDSSPKTRLNCRGPAFSSKSLHT